LIKVGIHPNLLGCVFLLSTFPLTVQAQDISKCATSISELKILLDDQSFPLKWIETTMDDGKPLRVSILEKNGALNVEFIKTNVGIWAESFGTICKNGAEIEIRFTKDQIRFGSAANWVLRYALRSGGKFTMTKLGSEQLRIATTGWSGTFSQIDH
jgi:hypothetical protein